MNPDQTGNREDKKPPVEIGDETLEEVAGGTLISPTTSPTVPTSSATGGGGTSTPTGGSGGFTPSGGTLTPSSPNKA